MARPSHKEIRSALEPAFDHSGRSSLRIGGFRSSAVLVPLIEHPDRYTLLFTKRTETVETHKGQISFPGGMADGSDGGPVETALREANEEVGIQPETVRVRGLLDDIATPAGFVITPVVGVLPPLEAVVRNEVEVAEVFEVEVDFFTDPQNGRLEFREKDGRMYEVWFYDTGTHVIWGATAMIIRLLLRKLGFAR